MLASANATFGIFAGGSGGQQQQPATKIVKIINIDGGNGGGHGGHGGGGYSGDHGHGHASPTINLIVPCKKDFFFHQTFFFCRIIIVMKNID